MTPLQEAGLGIVGAVPAALGLIALARVAGRIPRALLWCAALIGVARPPHAFVTWPRWLDAMADAGPWILASILVVEALVAASAARVVDRLGLATTALGHSFAGLAPRACGAPVGFLALATGVAAGIGRVAWDLPGGTRLAPVALLTACVGSLLLAHTLMRPAPLADEQHHQ